MKLYAYVLHYIMRINTQSLTQDIVSLIETMQTMNQQRNSDNIRLHRHNKRPSKYV